MHNLFSSFVLGYHGCSQEAADQVLANQPFKLSANEYDWLGSGVYFWESNPDRAWQWAEDKAKRAQAKGERFEPAVVGAVIHLGYCLDLISTNGISAVLHAYQDLKMLAEAIEKELPENLGGRDLLQRKLDCAVINYLHAIREQDGETQFDSVRGVFVEGEEIYPTSGFHHKTHIQICVRNQENIHGVFRVHDRYFSVR